MGKVSRLSLILVSVFLLMALGRGAVQAQQNQMPAPQPVVVKHEGLPSPGLLPTSPLYFVKKVFENIGTFFTFGSANKAIRHFDLAAKRLSEAETLAAKGEFERAKPIFDQYEKEIQITQKYLDKAVQQGKDMSKLAERILKVLPISATTVGEKRQAEESLQEVKEEVPPQAQTGLQIVEQNLQKTAQKILIKKQSEQTTKTLQTLSQYKGSDQFGQCDGFSSRTIAEDIQDTKALGFGWARPLGDLFAQETIEKQKGSYDFSTTDTAVRELQSAGLKIFGTLFPTGTPKIPQSADMASFENYVKAVVDRYNGDGKNDMPGLTSKITYWEVGIEPFCSTPGENCYKTFFDLVKTAYQAAKSVDASLAISPGGPAPIFGPNSNEEKPVSALFGYFFEKGGANYMDFFNFHYLVGTKNQDIRKYVDYWKQYVPQDKEIWLSETGSRDVGDRFTISSNTTEEANWVKEHISNSFQVGLSKIFWCRAEHSYSDMPEVVRTLQEYAKQYGGNPIGTVAKRQTQQIPLQTSQQGGMMQQQGGMMQQGQGSKNPGGYCGDNKCDSIELQTGGCLQDCK